MSKRFLGVLKGYRGEAARTKYLQHLQGLNKEDRIGTKGNRPPTVPLYITPFAFPLGANIFVKASALQPAVAIFSGKTEWSSRVQTAEEMTNTETGIRLKGYAAPRIVHRTIDQTGSGETSKLTGLRYLKYTSNSASVPFGKKTGDTGALTVFNEIANTFSGNTQVRFSFVEERV